MRISTKRVEELIKMEKAELERDCPTYVERDDFADDLLEARKLLKKVSAVLINSWGLIAKDANKMITEYFKEEPK